MSTMQLKSIGMAIGLALSSTAMADTYVNNELKRIEGYQTIQNEQASVDSANPTRNLQLNDSPKSEPKNDNLRARNISVVEPTGNYENVGPIENPNYGYKKSVDLTSEIEEDMARQQDRKLYISNYEKALKSEIQREINLANDAN